MERTIQPSAALLELLEGDDELIARLNNEADDAVMNILNKAATLPVEQMEALAEILKKDIDGRRKEKQLAENPLH